jgi:hypothetical protein
LLCLLIRSRIVLCSNLSGDTRLPHHHIGTLLSHNPTDTAGDDLVAGDADKGGAV